MTLTQILDLMFTGDFNAKMLGFRGVPKMLELLAPQLYSHTCATNSHKKK